MSERTCSDCGTVVGATDSWTVGPRMASRPLEEGLLLTVAEFDTCLWHHRARVISITDGDTLVARPELGYVRDLGMSVAYRLRGVYCPELPRGNLARVLDEHPDDPGVQAYIFLSCFLADVYSDDGWFPLRVITYEKERATVNIGGFQKSFDRWIADMWRVNADGTLTNLAEAIIAAGHGTREPVSLGNDVAKVIREKSAG